MSSELVACTQHCTDKNILLSMHRAKYFHIYQNFLHKFFFFLLIEFKFLNFSVYIFTCIKQMLIYTVGKV